MQIKRAIQFQVAFLFVVLAAGLTLSAFHKYAPDPMNPLTFFPALLAVVLGPGGNPEIKQVFPYILGSVLQWGLIGYWLSLPFAIIFEIRSWQKDRRVVGRDESNHGESQPVTEAKAGFSLPSRLHWLRPLPGLARSVWLTVIKRQRFLITLAAGLTVLLIGCATYAWSYWSPSGPIVSGPGYEGVLMAPPRFQAEIPEIGSWQPTVSQVRELEAEFLGYAYSRRHDFGTNVMERLPHYKRLYRGITKDGRRLMHIAFVNLESEGVGRRRWLYGVMISHTWEDYWTVWYDPASRRFSNASPFDEDWYRRHMKP